MRMDDNDLSELLDNEDPDSARLWPPALRRMIDVVEAHFRDRGHNNPRREAEAVVVTIAEYLGGRATYLPRGDSLRTALRNLRICDEFTGRNVSDLSRRYDLSDRQIHRIVNRHRNATKRNDP